MRLHVKRSVRGIFGGGGGGGGQRASRGRLIDIFSTLESIHVSRRDQREGGSGEGGGERSLAFTGLTGRRRRRRRRHRRR